MAGERGFLAITPGAGHLMAVSEWPSSTHGIPDDADSGDDEMFAVMHAMRSRIITSPSFTGDRILGAIDQLTPDQHVMLELTLPEHDDLYADLVTHPNVLRVAALSGGYTRQEANSRLARNHGVTASFSRALTEGLTVQQSAEEFDAALNDSINTIYEAAIT